MFDDSGFHEQSKGLNIKFSKEKGDLFSFQCRLIWHFHDMGVDTITYFNDLSDPTKMVNLTDHMKFTQAFAVEEQCKLYNSYI